VNGHIGYVIEGDMDKQPAAARADRRHPAGRVRGDVL
jgi:hypothetical protein